MLAICNVTVGKNLWPAGIVPADTKAAVHEESDFRQLVLIQLNLINYSKQTTFTAIYKLG